MKKSIHILICQLKIESSIYSLHYILNGQLLPGAGTYDSTLLSDVTRTMKKVNIVAAN